MQRYQPTDSWPAHSKPWFQTVFKEARARGWTLEAYSNHNNYLLVCPGSVCRLQVFSTGVGGESAAKTIGKQVKRCLHGRQDLVEDLLRATDLLDHAERLLDAVAVLRERDRADATLERIVGQEDFNEDAAEDLLAEVDALTGRAHELLGIAADDATDDVLRLAGDDLTAARGLLQPLPRDDGEVKLQRKRLRQLQDRRRSLNDSTTTS